MGLAFVASIADMDYNSHLDTESRTFGFYREVVRASNVQWFAHRSKHGAEPKEG